MYLQRIRSLAEDFPGGIRKIAKTIGVSESTLHRYINHNKIMSDKLEQISMTLRVSPAVFFEQHPAQNAKYIVNTVSGNENNVGDGASNLEELMKEKERLIQTQQELIETQKILIDKLRGRF